MSEWVVKKPVKILSVTLNPERVEGWGGLYGFTEGKTVVTLGDIDGGEFHVVVPGDQFRRFAGSLETRYEIVIREVP